MIKLLHTDIGRAVRDFSSSLAYEDMVKDAGEVLRTLIPKEVEVSDKNGLWYLMKVLPYRTVDNVIDGVVITFTEITGQKHTQEVLSDTLIYAESIIDTIREPLIVLDAGMKVVSANKTFYLTFKAVREDTEGKIIYDLGKRQWDIPKLRELLEDILRKKTEFHDYEVEHDFPSVGHKKLLLNARRVYQKGKGTEMILLVMEDVTAK